MNLIIHAARLANGAHRGQKRKYTGEPYIAHPARVAAKVIMLDGATDEMVAAAWMHDTIEDADYREAYISSLLGETVGRYVAALTNPSKGRDYLFREEKKAMDREHLAKQCREVQVIKLCDRIDNVNDLRRCCDSTIIARRYHAESLLLADILRGASDELHLELMDSLEMLDIQLKR